jgi:hypothetical protein
MRLAVVSDETGAIRAVAVCQVTFDHDPFTTSEMEITAEPASTDAEQHLRCHLIKAPAHLLSRRGYELVQGINEIRTSMRVHLTGRKAKLIEAAAD